MRASFATMLSSHGRHGSPARNRAERAPRLQRAVLDGVLRVGRAAGDEVGHSECDLLVRANELGEGAVVPALRAQDELALLEWTALHRQPLHRRAGRVPLRGAGPPHAGSPLAQERVYCSSTREAFAIPREMR